MIFLQAAMGVGIFLISIIIFIPILWIILFVSFGIYNQNIELKNEKRKFNPLKYATFITLIVCFIIIIYLFFIFTSEDFLKYS